MRPFIFCFVYLHLLYSCIAFNARRCYSDISLLSIYIDNHFANDGINVNVFRGQKFSTTVLNRLVQFNVIRRYVKTNSIHTTHRLNALAAPPGIRV